MKSKIIRQSEVSMNVSALMKNFIDRFVHSAGQPDLVSNL